MAIADMRVEVTRRPPPLAVERERAFNKARRHSVLVKTLRIALPLAAVAGVAFYALTLLVSWHLNAGRFKVESMHVTADDLTMKNPRYSDKTKDGGRYEVRAKRAIVEFNQKAPIKLIDVDGDMEQASGVVTKIKSKHGLYDNAKGELELYDGIEVDATNGLVARLSRATLYSKEHLVVSKHPVTASMPTGSVKAASMSMKTDTREAKFRGAVEVRLKQTGQGVGFGRDARQPVDITAETLDIDDRPVGETARTAHFKGNVVAVQGETTLTTSDLHVKYEGKGAAELATAAPQPAQPGESGTRVSLLKARGGVVVVAGAERRVTSGIADFDAKAETALFVGNVVVNQGKNVLRGRRLAIDRKQNKSRLESPAEAGQAKGRVAATFYQSETKAAARQRNPADVAKETAFGAFRNDPTAPMEVEADTLDVDDRERTAIFRGLVKARQGEFTVDTAEMTAIYTGQAGLGLASPGEEAKGQAQAQLTRIEARKTVLIKSKDGQSASGESANFDVKANTVLLWGKVVVTRGKDIAEGPRLLIDLTSGLYRFEVDQDKETAAAQQASAPADPVRAEAVTGPALSSSPPETPTQRTCPPGKQCMLFYPKEAKERAKAGIKKLLPEGGEPIPSPVQQGN
jgi:lipopolysaccharide transport protein LptA